MKYEPTWRKPTGMLLILLIIAVWAVLVASLSGWIGQLPTLAQCVIYIFLGIIWIAPMKPLLSWMETGRWRSW
ncbi:MAG TPA: DUF2842 domain-containing protein [Sphingobium sp.]|uniref:DUF2842 domain-containing protein n=1 Tax=Sphingobium sp. TaxID=1912891 RepID=UPI002ED1EE11